MPCFQRRLLLFEGGRRFLENESFFWRCRGAGVVFLASSVRWFFFGGAAFFPTRTLRAHILLPTNPRERQCAS
jgi:hypothetical protein